MGYIPRTAEKVLLEMAKGYAVIVITGPRQSGKSTLAQKMFTEKPYVSLEDIDYRDFADDDPRGFLKQYPDGAILDEVQRCPHLLSYIQTIVDRAQQSGMFILTGSAQFQLLQEVTQSLAGRAGLIHLLPFTMNELAAEDKQPLSIEALLFQGGFPPIYDHQLDPVKWYANYIQTYIERDVRNISAISDLRAFQRFIQLCAGRIGQLVNFSSIANDVGVSYNTIKAWLTVLEAGYMVVLLPPHFTNFNKRIIKTPKLYFSDTGLAARLLGIERSSDLGMHPFRGNLFENWVIMELLKSRFNKGLPSNLYFWRDRTGNEIDLIIDKGATLTPLEIKSGMTVNASFFKALKLWRNLAEEKTQKAWLVYAGEREERREAAHVVPWRKVDLIIKQEIG